MDFYIVQLFVKLCVSYAYQQSTLDEETPHFSQSKREELISLLEECLVMALFFLDTPMQIRIYFALGGLYRRVYQPAKEMEINQDLGNIHQSINEYHKAIECHRRSLRIAKEIGDRMGEESAYGNLGIAYQSINEYHKAIECHRRSLSIAKEIGDRMGEKSAYGNLGIAYQSIREYHKAIEYYQSCLSIAKEIRDRKGEGTVYLNLGITYKSLGEYHKAIQYYEKCLSIAKEVGDRQGEGSTYGNLGNAYGSLGEYDKAIQFYEKCLSIAKEVGDRQIEGRAYGNLGNAYRSLGEYDKAIQFYEKCLSIAKEIGDRQGEGATYGNLGNAYHLLGKNHKAMEYLLNSLSIAKEIGDRHGEGVAYGNLGNAYQSLGEYRKAIEFQEKKLGIAKEIGDRRGETTAYGNLGSSYGLLRKYQKAISYHGKSLSIAKEIGDRQGEGNSYGSLGIAYRSLGEYQTAIEYHEERLRIVKEIGDRQGEGATYGNLGIAYGSLGEYCKAIENLEKSLSIAKEIGDKKGEAVFYQNIGSVYQAESSIKDLSKSQEYLKQSMHCFEQLFDDLKDKDHFKVSIVDTFIITYKMLSYAYIQTGQIEEALLVCERGRARALKDLLFPKYNTTEETRSKELEGADVKAISSHREGSILFYNLHLNKLTYHSWIMSSCSTSTFFYDELDNRDALATIESSLSEDAETNIKTGYFQYLVDNSFQQMNVREGKGMKCEDRSMNLKENEDLEPASSTDSSNLSDAVLKVFQKIDRCIPDEEDDDLEPLDMLFYRLVSPVLHQLTLDEVIIIPDGPLFMVPFAALQDRETGKYLSETKRIRVAPSLTTLKLLQESSDKHFDKSGALIIGNPITGHLMRNSRIVMFSELPGAEEEAIEIGNLLGVQPLIGTQATKEAVLRRLQEGVSVIHFAAHGCKENGQIALAPSKPTTYSSPAEEKDCILTMKEVQESGIRAQLVVLSCCYSGRGDIKSEGVVGMTRAFLAAGARAVVASLWAIDDTATKFFMLKFYSHLKKGESASASLQQTMNEMREMGYREPMYWAGFFLIGDDVTITV